MTREEAINMLYGMRADNLNLDDAYTKDKYEALDMAIKALEQMPVTTTAGEGGVIYYPQVEGVTPTVVSTEKEQENDMDIQN